jgi:hypothetical protein
MQLNLQSNSANIYNIWVNESISKNYFCVNLLALFENFTFSQDRKIMAALLKWSSLQKV